jgi:hypothetical protein
LLKRIRRLALPPTEKALLMNLAVYADANGCVYREMLSVALGRLYQVERELLAARRQHAAMLAELRRYTRSIVAGRTVV